MRGLAVFCCVAILVGSLAARAAEPASPIDNFASLGAAIMACWKPPAGSELTLRFGLTGQGALRGPPMVTYSKLIGAADLRKAFVVSALRAVADCTPVKLSEEFGRIIAQRVLTVRFTQPASVRPAI